jgi:hypothetical protein
MRKLRALREYLLEAPLGLSADKLLTFAEAGTVTSHRGHQAQNQNFLVGYTAHIIVTDYTGDEEQLLYLVTSWLHREQPGAKDDALSFHLDVIDHQRVDISLKVTLVETVTVTQDPAGTWLTPARDPDTLAFPLFP